VLSALMAGCGGGSVHELRDAAITSRDVPADWGLADFGDAEAQRLWAVLPELLASDSETRLFVRALQGENGLHGTATILIETGDPAALPKSTDGERALGPLSRLLAEQDAFLNPDIRGGDPGAYFAVSDVPLPGSLHSRLVRLLDDGYLFSDSTIFSVGPVLAVVTVWYPEQDGPFRQVDELASDVADRLQVYLGEG
jgi:hypothetical protein